MIIRIMEKNDFLGWFTMRKQLWPDCRDEDQYSEMEMWRKNADQYPVMVACEGGIQTGFLEATFGFHNLVPIGVPVFYIEGLFVDKDYRWRGVAPQLINFAGEFAKRKRLGEIYSDTDLWNESSADAHRRMGFKELRRTDAELIFKKSLI